MSPRSYNFKLSSRQMLVLSFLLVALSLFPEDGSLPLKRYYVTAARKDSQFSNLLRKFGVEIRVDRSGAEFIQDILFFDEEGTLLELAELPQDGSFLFGLTLEVLDPEGKLLLADVGVLSDPVPTRKFQSVFAEGGGVISGRFKDGEPYVLIEWSAIRRTQQILSLRWREKHGLFADQHLKDIPLEIAHLETARDFGVKPENLISVPYGGHLDLIIKALPGGRLLVHHPRQIEATLEALLRDPTRRDRIRLEKLLKDHLEGFTQYYSNRAPKHLAGKPMGPARPLWDARDYKTFDRVVESLKPRFEVIEVAGIFREAGSHTILERINFFNGFVFQAPSDGKLVAMTNFAPEAPSLEEYWREVLQSQNISKDRIYFPGRYSAGAGLDCFGAQSGAPKP